MFIESFGCRGRVEPSEYDGQLAAPGFFELVGAAPSVVDICPHSFGHRQSHQPKESRDRTGYGAGIWTPLADVVKERSLDCLGVVREQGCDMAGDGEGMALIGNALLPEQLRTRAGEAAKDESLFFWSQRGRTKVPEEPQNQMPSLSQAHVH